MGQSGQVCINRHIPALDAWRGIAILMVLFDHIQYAALGNYIRPWTQTGRHGVTLFFVLSGFLITTNLITERNNLKEFYLRRCFRLMPTAWLFLGTLLLTHLTSWTEIRGCLLFYRNFQNITSIAGHFWSLSIEEQFYLVWPSVLLLFGVRRCRWIAGLAAAGIAVFRLHFWQHYEQLFLLDHTEVRADALLIGCLLAALLSDLSIREQAAPLLRWLAPPAFIGLLVAVWKYHLLQPLWECVSIAILLAATSLDPPSIIRQILEWKPLVWLGGVSYSIYVWQEPFMHFHPRPMALAISAGVAMPVFALSCHYFVEMPLRQIGRKLAARIEAPQTAQIELPVLNHTTLNRAPVTSSNIRSSYTS